MRIYPPNEDCFIHSFKDLIISQNAHYTSINGRYFAHLFVQAFCALWGHTAFAIINGFFYILFYVFLLKLCKVKLLNIMGVISVLIIGLITFQTRMTPSGQIGYIWMYSLTMIYLYVFFKNPKCNAIIAIVSGILSIIVGNGHESLNLGLCVALIIYWLKNIKQMSLLQYCMMIGFGIGTLIICLSPGLKERADNQMSFNVQSIINTVMHLLVYLRATYFLVIILLYKIIREKYCIKSIYRENVFLWNTWIFLLIFNVFIVDFLSNRSAFGLELISIILAFRLLSKHSMTKVWISILGSVLIVVYTMQANALIEKHRFYEEIETQYSNTNDGIVYADLDYSKGVLLHTNFAMIIEHNNLGGEGGWYQYNLQRYLRTKYLGKPDVKILPLYLKGRQREDIGNKIIEIPGEHYLVIQSKSNPQDFVISRSISILGYNKTFAPVKIDFSSDADKFITWKGDNWKARIIDKRQYTIPLIHSFNISLVP